MDIVISILVNIYLIVSAIFSVIGALLLTYFIVVAFLGWWKRKSPSADEFEKTTRFAVVVAAHNERYVIEETIQTLRNADYDNSLYDIYVVADNCTDDTAALARKQGALVYERADTEKRGKGFAVEWMFEKIWETGIPYDAICLLDADNLIDKNFFKEMNKSLKLGYKIVQGYLGCKNPHDTYISGCYSISYWTTNRVFQLARHNLGLSCGLGGTGFVMTVDLLKDFGWGAYCLTEDLEFQLKCVEHNVKVAWNHDAIFYDEKPLKLKQSMVQRTRWMQGHSDCVDRYFVKLLKKAWKEKSWICYDNCLYLIQLYLFCIMQLICLLGISVELISSIWIHQDFFVTTGWLYGSLFTIIFTLFVLAVEKKLTFKLFFYTLILPIFVISWVPPIIKGWFTRNNTVWAHTEHKRSIKVDDVVAS